MKIKTLAELKRFMSKGQQWDCKQMVGDMVVFNFGTRTLVHKDTVKIGFETWKYNPETEISEARTSYCDYPKAKDISFFDDGDHGFGFVVKNPFSERELVYTLITK